MTKILFVIPRMGGGGAERIVSYLVNEFGKLNNYDVNLLLFEEKGNTYIKHINPEVKITNLKLKHRLRYNIINIVKEIIKAKPDICFIGLDALNIILAPFVPLFKFHGIKVIVRETNVLSKRYTPNIINKIAYRLFYNNYDNIICQSKDMANDLINVWGINSKKINIINNPIDIDLIQNKSLDIIPKLDLPLTPYLVAIGRLSHQKGFDRLIDLIAGLNKKRRFPYKLYILGEGELRDCIEEKINNYGLSQQVILLGRIDNPFSIINRAKGLILSSHYEGFPNVLLEANALGIPVFSNMCPGGINEIIIEGDNGLSANFNDEEDFENKFEVFMNTKFDKEIIINMTRKRYDMNIIFPKYKKLFVY